MPYKDPAQQRRYAAQWMARRRAEWFAGRTCARCGSSENLVLDHCEPALKVSHRIWSWAKERREAELAKCQALCLPCHKRKSARESPQARRNGLTDEAVRLIRASPLPTAALAEQFSVHQTTIYRIRRRETWRHVT